ncbi:MAG: tetratricopeptide repeat protein [Prevotellaceae bacterium]|jgi:tetratricopeptide (TPR) repeat protein|nr:tetratricopeptide repeat protein [Prevotellaceae bacterium]
MANEWYRKTTWTTEDENEFFLKLKRSQKFNRPQYLRIQASALADTNNNELLNAALELLEKYFNEYPDNKFEKSPAFKLKGDIYFKMEKYEMALESYKNAIDFEKSYPQIKTDAYLNYSELVIQLNKTDLFGNVEILLLKQAKELDFPKDRYVKNAILSIIYKCKNNMEKSNYYKTLAEEAANAENSDFRWHKKLGLVNKRNKLLDKLMK